MVFFLQIIRNAKVASFKNVNNRKPPSKMEVFKKLGAFITVTAVCFV